MAKISFYLDSELPAVAVLAATINFTESRPRLWPNIDPKVYRVHSMASSSAVVTEGSALLGGIWAREAYDWSAPGVVRATVQDSNAFQPGGTWSLETTPREGGGCRIQVSSHRTARGLKGRVIGAMLTLVGNKVLPAQLQQTLDMIANEMASGEVASAVAS